jgi:hypothetical protein
VANNLPILGPFVEPRRRSRSVSSFHSNGHRADQPSSPLPSIPENNDSPSSDSSFRPSSSEETDDSSVGSHIPAPLSLPDLVSIVNSSELDPHLDLRFDHSRSPSVAASVPTEEIWRSPLPIRHQSVPLDPDNYPRHWNWIENVESPRIERFADDIWLSVNRTFPRGSTPINQHIIQLAQFDSPVEEPVLTSSPMSTTESNSRSSIKYAPDMPEG